MAERNLVNTEAVSLDFGKGLILDSLSLGINAGDKIGIVGRNGGGKSTLLRVLSQQLAPDSGRVSVVGGCSIGVLDQMDKLPAHETIGSYLFGDTPSFEWASNPKARMVLEGLLHSADEAALTRELAPLSGGEKRRVALTKLLLSPIDVLFLDEPTNHLDVEAVAWLAHHLKSLRDLALVVVTHDRWFLDEVTTDTWEVVSGKVERYEGGYSAFVLAKAERERQAGIIESKRNNLIRKELAWLRRGAPARTSKPKFRIDTANELIANEPPPRDNVELLAFANSRLGKTVIELSDADVVVGDRTLLSHLTWNIGPGDRLALVGMNGAGKTSLFRALVGELPLAAGKRVQGSTVKIAYLSQALEELNPTWRVLEAVERVARRVELGKGRELSAAQLCEKLGFPPDAQWTPVGDLSGGERRRLQLTRLLMSEPNVLLLDEPTNDFDVETLTALEDLLDGFAGTLLVISHDRYFLERVCDRVYGLLGDHTLRDLPRGIDEYLELRAHSVAAGSPPNKAATADLAVDVTLSAADVRELKKEIQRLERTLSKLADKRTSLLTAMADVSHDYTKVADLQPQLTAIDTEIADVELRWLEISSNLEA